MVLKGMFAPNRALGNLPIGCVKRYGVLIALFTLGSWSSAALANETLRVGVYHNPPKLFADEQGQLRGGVGRAFSSDSPSRTVAA